jgi:hypothetical protein
MAKQTTATPEQLETVKAGDIYSYTNSQGYTTRYKVSRITEFSVFVYNWLTSYDGTIAEWSTQELREGWKIFSKYKLEK